MEEADRDRPYPFGHLGQRCGIHCTKDGPVGSDPFVDLEAQVTRHQGRRSIREVVEQAGPVLTGDLDDVGEPDRGEERDGREGAFEHGVGGNCGAVSERADARAARDGRRGRPHGEARVIRGGQHLGGGAVGTDRVGEGPPGIHPDPPAPLPVL